MHLNRPLLGQRVLDVLSLVKAIKSDNVQIVGVGITGPVALHAAALDGRIKEITLENSLPSWLSVVRAADQLQSAHECRAGRAEGVRFAGPGALGGARKVVGGEGSK